METTALIFLCSVALATGVLFFKPHLYTGKAQSRSAGKAGKNAKGTVSPRTSAQSPRSPYRATSIGFRGAACDAAKAISGKRFLDIDKFTPTLPMADCDLSRCNCIYEHNEDRRESHEDRRPPGAGLHSVLYERGDKPNRRKQKRGRRKSDWA